MPAIPVSTGLQAVPHFAGLSRNGTADNAASPDLFTYMSADNLTCQIKQADPNAWIDGPVQIVLSTEGGGGGGAERTCCDGLCQQGRDCPLNKADSQEFAFAPGRLSSHTYDDDDGPADPPLGWRGRLVLIGLLGISAAVAISGAWLLLDWIRHLAGA